MDPKLHDEALNLEDSGTLELGRLLAVGPELEREPVHEPPEFPSAPRRRDWSSRELLAQPFNDAGLIG